jgi:alpha-glucosidase
MTNERSRTVAIPLAFLRGGKFKADIWQDGGTANDVEHVVKLISNREVLHIHMRAGGGAAIAIKPLH